MFLDLVPKLPRIDPLPRSEGVGPFLFIGEVVVRDVSGCRRVEPPRPSKTDLPRTRPRARPPMPRSEMTKRQFIAWMKRMGFTPTRAAEVLGLHRNTIHNYMRGKQAGTNERAHIPKAVGLACAWLESPQGKNEVAHLSTRCGTVVRQQY